MGPFCSLRGHDSLQAASEVKFDLIFLISDLSYKYIPHIKVTSIVKMTLSLEEENHDPLTCVASLRDKQLLSDKKH